MRINIENPHADSMKSVLISIKPKWCELIASGKKTVELRKTRPKNTAPFKCYIYQTKIKWVFDLLRTLKLDKLADILTMGAGKVVGEFTCYKIEPIEIRHFTVFGHENRYTAVGENPDYQWLKKSCLSYDEVVRYGNFARLYGWHITGLVIYEKPKKLSEFKKPHDYIDQSYRKRNSLFKGITKPPQSWCYVEEVSR